MINHFVTKLGQRKGIVMGNILRMYFAWWFGGLGPKSNFYFNLSNRFVLKAEQRRNTCNVPRKCFAWFRGLGLLNPVS